MSDERRRQQEYHGDVQYEVWRSGGNPDAVDYDRVDDCFYDGDDAEDCAAKEYRRQQQGTRGEA